MKNPPKRSIIVCALPRTGSSLLCQALSTAWVAGQFEEWLEFESITPQRRERFRPEERPVTEYLDDAVSEEQSPNGVFGIKLMHAHLDLIPSTGKEADSIGDRVRRFFPNPVFLRITRNDKVAQAVSFARAQQSGVWSHAYGSKTIKPELLNFSYLAIHRYIEQIKHEEAGWQRFFEDNNLEYQDIVYEDFVSDIDGNLRKIIADAGIEEHFEIDHSKLYHTRMADEINTQWAARYTEIHSELSRSRSTRAAKIKKATLSATSQSFSLVAQDRVRIKVAVRNDGNKTWQPWGAIDGYDWPLIAYRWREKEGTWLKDDGTNAFDLNTEPLDRPLAPGDTKEWEFAINTPPSSGQFELVVDFKRGREGKSACPSLVIAVRALPNAVLSRLQAYFETPCFQDGSVGSHWLGSFDGSEFPKIRHHQWGELRCSGPGYRENSYFFHHEACGWFWTTPEQFPLCCRMEDKEWASIEELVKK